MTERDRRRWLAAGTVLLTAMTVAVVSPPQALEATSTLRLFAALAAAGLVGVGVLPALVTRSLASRPVWIAAAVVALAAGLGTYLLGSSSQRDCTATYDGRATVVGTAWTVLGESYAREHPGLSKSELLFDSAGVADRLWTRASIARCRTILASTYFLWIPCLALCLYACVQAVPTALLTVTLGRPAGTVGPPGPPSPLVYDVFISYRHGGHDGGFARELLAALERRGYRVAIDERDFPANASFLQEMERCIRQSRFTIAVISSRYLGSGHCEEEAILCRVLDMGDRRRRLIPLVIEPVPLPAWLFGIVGIDCSRPDPLVDPFDRLRATLGPPLSASSSTRGDARDA